MQLASFASETVLFGATPVENEFIMEYMPQAPGDFVRVYLFMLFKCQYPAPGDGVADAARTLGMGEDEILRAMRYWERQGLWRRVADNPPRFEFIGCRQITVDDTPCRNRELHTRLQGILGEEYVIQPRDFVTIADWQEVFGLPAEVIVLLVENEVKRAREKRRSLSGIFGRMDKTAREWASSGVVTPEEARERIAREGAGYEMARRVIRQFNLRREPTVDEIALADRWANEMRLTDADVLAACAETVRARNPSFAYLDSILRRHASGGAGVQADIQEERRRVEALKEVYAELGAPGAPAPTQLKTFSDFLEMGFRQDTLVEAARRCAREGMHDFAAWEKYVSQCAQKGLFTLEALRANTRRIDGLSEAAERVMRAYGDDRRAGNADRTWIEKWMNAMPMDVILLAAERAQGTQLPRKYMGKLLSNWQKKGIRTVEEARKEEPVVRIEPKAQAGRAVQDYSQREYRDEDFAVDAVMQMWMEDGKKNDAQ